MGFLLYSVAVPMSHSNPLAVALSTREGLVKRAPLLDPFIPSLIMGFLLYSVAVPRSLAVTLSTREGPVKRGNILTKRQPIAASKRGIVLKRNATHFNINARLREETTLQNEQLTCPICDRKFYQKSDVKRHMVVHTGEKFACSYCPKQFSQKYTRNMHEKIHTCVVPSPLEYSDEKYSHM